eukprot:scaffold40450_cov219-Skeletonema_marinoi.AAC.1
MATETINTTSTTARSCGHCGKTSSSLLRCSQCKLVYYCSRSCQSLAWKNGHRQACRKAKTAAATSNNGGDQSINATMTELMQHVQTMDCRTAYENMCRAQDEIERLQKQLDEDEMEEEEGDLDEADDDDDVSIVRLEGGNDSTATSEKASADDNNSQLSSEIDPSPPSESKAVKEDTNINIKRAHGSWLDEGGKFSIEYLPNIKCYHITLTTNNHDDSTIVPNRDDLQFTMSPVPNPCESKSDCSSSQIVFYEMRLVHSPSSTLLSLTLPGCQLTNHEDRPTATISTDSQSISLRIYLQINDSSSMDLMDNLLGIEAGSIFSPVTTPSTDINHLFCRNCQSPIITHNNNNSTIQSVLPLPSGYWDDIEDYLICYDGQANVDFNTSTMNAIRHVALEDDAVIVLHKDDVNEGGGGGVCTTRNVKGYGEHSALQSGR